jgi:hypothetical protein
VTNTDGDDALRFSALGHHADEVQPRRRRRRTKIATTTAASLVCLAGAALLVRSLDGERDDPAVSGPGASAGVDHPHPCAATGDGLVSWPGVASSAGADAARLAGQFSTSVLGTDGRAAAEVAETDGGCLVVVDHGSTGRAEVLLQTAGDQLVVAHYSFPAARDDAEAGLGLAAAGTTVRVNFDRTVCVDCGGRLAVRYGDAQASGPLDATGEGTVTIDRDMTVPGTVLMTVHAPDGAIVEAVGISVPPGDFAAG